MAIEKFEPRLGAESRRMERFRALNTHGLPPQSTSGVWNQRQDTGSPPPVQEQQAKTPETSER